MRLQKYLSSTVKTIYPLLLVLLVLNALLPLSVSAMEDYASPRIPPDVYNQIESQYYTVTFDGEGEALVSLKLILSDKNLSTLSFKIPGSSVRVLNVIQEVETVEKTCQPSYYPVYDIAESTKKCEQYSENLKCTEWDANLTCVKYEKECIKYAEQCSYYYDSYTYSYYSADHSEAASGDSTGITVTLPKLVTSDTPQKVVLLLSYKVEGVASKSWGVFNYDLTTVEIDRDIEYTRVAINVIDPFILKGGDATVDYRPSPTLGVFESAASEKLEASTDSQYGEASRYIEYSYGLVEETQALDPLETFAVKGTYAESKIALYKGRIIAIGVVILAVLIGLIFGARAIIKSLGNAATQHRTQSSRTASLRVSSAHAARKVRASSSASPQDLAHTTFVVGVASFLSAILVFATWYLAKFVMNALSDWLGYSYNYSLLQSFISMAIFLVATILILLEIAVPPFWVAFKKGWLPGVLTFVATLVWLVLIIVVVISLYVATSGGYY